MKTRGVTIPARWSVDSGLRAKGVSVVAAAVLWGSIGLFVRGIDAPSTTITFYRVLFGALSIGLVVLFRGERGELRIRDRGLLERLALMSFFYAVNWVLFFKAIQLTSLSNAVLSYYTAPAVMAVLGHVVLKERVSGRGAAAIGVAFIGLFLLFRPSGALESKSTLGLLCGVTAGVMYASAVITAKPITSRLSHWTVAFYQTAGATLLLLPFAVIDRVNPLSFDRVEWTKLLALGLIHTTIAFGLFFGGIKYLSAVQVGLIMYLDPLSAVLFSRFVLGEAIHWQTAIGGALIVLAGLAMVIKGGMESASEAARDVRQARTRDRVG